MHEVPNTSFPHTNRKVSVWGRLTEDASQIYHKEKRPRLLANSFSYLYTDFLRSPSQDGKTPWSFTLVLYWNPV